MENKLASAVFIFCVFLFANRTKAQNTLNIDNVSSNKYPSGQTTKDTDTVYDTYDKPPEFPGGSGNYREYLMKNFKMHEELTDSSIHGVIYVSMIVNKDGSLSDVKILKDHVGYGYGEEAVRVFKGMPAWVPAKINGKPVCARYVIPVKFVLH